MSLRREFTADDLHLFQAAIAQTAHRFQAKTCCHPTKIYVGRLEDEKLDAIAQRTGDRISEAHLLRTERRTFAGYAIFVVDAETHLAAGL